MTCVFILLCNTYDDLRLILYINLNSGPSAAENVEARISGGNGTNCTYFFVVLLDVVTPAVMVLLHRLTVCM